MSQLNNVRLTIDGQEVAGFQTLSIVQDIYSIDSITISFRIEALEDDGTFLIENSKDFIGKRFSINSEIVQYGNTESEDGFSYQGLVTAIDGQRSGSRSSDIITISGKSPDIILKGKPTNKTFHEKTLSDIVNEVLRPYPTNILNPTVSPSHTETIPYIVQYKESDYDFIHRLARKFGEWFFYNGQELYFGELPEIDETELILGVDLDTFAFSLQTEPPKFKFRTIENTFNDQNYDFVSGRNNIQQQANQYVQHAYDESGNVFSEQAVRRLNNLNRDVSQLQEAMDFFGNLEELTDVNKMSETTGNGTNKQIKIGQIVDIIHPGSEDSSEQNYGRFRLTVINHYCDHMLNYQNSFNAMQAGIEIPENTNVNVIVHSEPIRGYVIDNADPDNVGRVQVDFGWNSDRDRTPWIRCASNYTTENGGNFFVPEIYSEVLVGFVDGDVDQPYIMGSFFSTDVRPFYPDSNWTGDPNNKKAIRTRSGNTIEIHDNDGEEKVIIYDKDEQNKITLDSANGVLTIQSQGDLNLSANNIKLEAQEDIELKANNELNIDATTKINVVTQEYVSSPSTKFQLESTSIEIKAHASLKLEGVAAAEFGSSVVTSISGALVKIN